MSVHKDERNNGKWLVIHKGHKKRGFQTKRDAVAFERQLILQESDIGCNEYIYDVAVQWLEDVHEKCSYGTFNKCKRTYELYVQPNIKNKRISQVTTKDCLSFHRKVQEMEFSTTHKNYIQYKYKSIFQFACKYLGLKDNPANVLDSFSTTHDEKVKRREKEQNVWTEEEFEKFICCVDQPKYTALFCVLFYTGLRLGEAQALKWKDYKDGYLDVYKSYTNKTDKGPYEIKDTKTPSSVRKVRLNSRMIEILDTFKEKQKRIVGYSEEWYIFGNITPLPRSNIDTVKGKACKASGVKKIRLHDFRHSHATNLINSGVNIVAVSRRLGHSDINMTLKIYTHLLDNSEDALIETIENTSQKLPKLTL